MPLPFMTSKNDLYGFYAFKTSIRSFIFYDVPSCSVLTISSLFIFNTFSIINSDEQIRCAYRKGSEALEAYTCVQIKHMPTGIIVRAERERSQGLNRLLALRLLILKIEEKLFGKKSPEQLKRDKNRKQKKRRYRRAKKKLD